MNTENNCQTTEFMIWSTADLLKQGFQPFQYGRIILPFTLLRCLECVLGPTKETVLAGANSHANLPDAVREILLLREAEQPFFNTSSLILKSLSDTQADIDLMRYVQSFSQDVREIFEHFHFADFVQQLSANNLLYQVVQRFASIDLNPHSISDFGMGLIFKELIRKFAESSGQTSAEHLTPRDIMQLTTSLALTGQEHKLQPNSILTIYDPTAGTGSFLSEGDEYVQQVSEKVNVSLYGQELRSESYAICKAHMLIKGQKVEQIKLGNTLADDQLYNLNADIMLSNPPFGVGWKKVLKQVVDEHKFKGFDGRFGPGLPRVSDGSLLFLLHLVSKMRDPRDGGSRIGIILNGSPMFTGGAGSGESEIRRYLLQSDMVEAIFALPTDMFYNTGISTYIWILSNNKPASRKGKVQLIDASGRASKMRRGIGRKRHLLSQTDRDDIVKLYGKLQETKESKIFPNEAFGYRRITVERPLRFMFNEESDGGIEALRVDKTFLKVPENVQWGVLNILVGMVGSCSVHGPILSRYEFRQKLIRDMEHYALPGAITETYLKLIEQHVGQRSDEAEICFCSKGMVEADPQLRSNVKVPLGQPIYTYFEREIKPEMPDAWVDDSRIDGQDGEAGIVGFEVSFN